MKASIKLDLSQKPFKKGYPVYLHLRADANRFKKKTICRSWPEDFDTSSYLPLNTHPDYDLLISDFLNYHNYIRTINAGKVSYNDALDLLFGAQKLKHTEFYKAASVLFDGSTNGNLYKTVCNSFNLVYPKISIENITTKKAQHYMTVILTRQKPNGVHTYLRTLDSIFKKISDLDSPFKGVRPRLEVTPPKDLTDADLKKLFYTRTIVNRWDYKSSNDSINYFRYYYMLLFYLGGIDMVDLAALRYDKNVVDGRIQFTRAKGGTDAFVNNKIFKVAEDLLKKFDCYPFLVPIYKYADHHNFVIRMNKKFTERVKDLNLSRKPLTKSARYSFINRAQQLLIDERITAEIVGHKRKSTTSIYTNEFPLAVRDAAHEKIIMF